MMRSKIQHLYEIIQSNPLDRKILIVSSHAQGHQWLEQVTRQYGSVLNTEVRTLETWALERSKLSLAKKKLRYLSSTESKWIVCKLLQEISQSGNGYLTGIALTPGLTDAFHQALIELRESGVRSEGLDPEHFEQAAKGTFVKELLARYEDWLKENKFVDLAGLLDDIEQLTLSNDTIIIDEYAIRSESDRRLVQAFTAGNYMMLCDVSEFTAPDSPFPAEGAQFFHTVGAIAEAREVMRRIVEQKIPWDQVEIIASDKEKNAAAVYTVASTSTIPCTFAGGLPIGVTNAGKAAKLYVEWMESGFNLDPILSALKQGIIGLRDDQFEEAKADCLIQELEQSGIGWGRERYKLLTSLLKVENIQKERLTVLQLLQRVFTRLFEPLTEQALCTPVKLVHELTQFIKAYAVLKEESDHQVIDQLQSLQQSMRAAGDFVMDGDLALRYVREGLDNLRVQTASTPSPGHVHVASLSSGGQTGRPYTFIMGMTETNWSTSFRQDPVILDEERERISSGLLLSSSQAKRLIEERNSRVSMIRGYCTMSYCSYAISEQREYMPAYEMLQVFRKKTKQANADYEVLHHTMEDAKRYCRTSSGIAVDTVEIWMRSLLTNPSRLMTAQQVIYFHYPSLRDGAKAVQARSEPKLSSYDGIVETDRYPVLLPGEAGASSAFSASSLERYGRCPLQYFYQYILGVRAKEAAVYDRTQWLNASQRGSLLHDIFDLYLMSVKEYRTQGNDSVRNAAELLHTITEQVIQQYAEEVPAPSEHILNKEAESIRKDVDIFIAGERNRMTIPVYTELQLHRDDSPLQLKISDEWSLPIKGFVDRVDEVAPHRYKIYDYKTGNPRKFKQNECFSGGTQIQLPLYGLAVEQWMKESGVDGQAQVVESAYLFPTERGMGEEVSRPQNRREDLKALLVTTIGAMKQGLYPPANDSKQCTWCDYNAVCGSHAELFAYKRDAPENAARLELILEVNRFA